MARVLIVDDDPQARMLLGLQVTDAGHEPAFAADAAEAIRMARALGPELILIDLFMPKVDGLDLLAALRAEAPAPPRQQRVRVVVITAAPVASLRRRALAMGADAFLDKLELEGERIAGLLVKGHSAAA